MKLLGISFIILGLILTVYTTFSFFSKDKILDLGRVEISKEKEHKVSWSPVIGIILLAAGGVLVWRSSKK
jgi:LPXTG-motif cell wall-anchored protein